MRAAMILCAGLGTRLRPLTEWLAKPMVPIGDAPAVEHIAARLRSAAFERVAVNVHHRPDDLRAWAARTGALVSEERVLLGTAGGVEHAAALLGDGDVLVWNGDILSDLDAGALVAAHEASGAVATLAVVRRPAGEGNVGLSARGDVVRLRTSSFGPGLSEASEASGAERPRAAPLPSLEEQGADFIGVHVVGASLRPALPHKGCLVGDVYIPALGAGARLATYPVTTSFIDVGSINAYVAANRAWLAARGEASWVGPGAIVNADVAGSIIGAGARIDADTLRCIVWPGAEILEPVRDAIVTPFGRVPL